MTQLVNTIPTRSISPGRYNRTVDEAKPNPLIPWLKRALGVVITLAIFAWMLKPVVREWDQVGERVKSINWGLFAVASLMFAGFLFVFRVTSWRTILAVFDYRLPVAPATRIWSTSELARYLPG